MNCSFKSNGGYNLHVSQMSQEEFESIKNDFKPVVEERALKIQSLNAQEAYLTKLLELKKQQQASSQAQQPITAQVTHLSAKDPEFLASPSFSDLKGFNPAKESTNGNHTKSTTSQGAGATAGKFSSKINKFKGLFKF